jgi:hypothetical protein
MTSVCRSVFAAAINARSHLAGLNENKISQPLAASSVANIENCFIKLNVNFTAASGWLQRMVRPTHGSSCASN